MKRYDCFRPGKVWLDTEGKRIQAHGGSIFYENGVFYLYGEDKEFSDGKSGVWHNGVRMYRSDDLYNWEDLGTVIPAEKDPSSSLFPSSKMDRPHIVFHRATGRYVCWIKVMSEESQTRTVPVADRLRGPYRKVSEFVRPLGMDAGDFDIAVASDGKAYTYFERVHSETICADLTDDYLGVSGYYSTHFPRLGPPRVREATAHFERRGKHYLFTSGTTGYYPNPTEVAVADSWHGPFRVLGNPHRGDGTKTSFRSQISSVFKVPGKKDPYIALADRWLPENRTPYAEYAAAYERACCGGALGLTPLCGDDALLRPSGESANTSVADYVWLPVVFEGENVFVDWRDEWRTEEFE